MQTNARSALWGMRAALSLLTGRGDGYGKQLQGLHRQAHRVPHGMRKIQAGGGMAQDGKCGQKNGAIEEREDCATQYEV